MIAIVIAAYLILLWNFTVTISNKTSIYEIKYNGLLWVGLDYWSIWKYDSSDKPMKWIDCKTEGK